MPSVGMMRLKQQIPRESSSGVLHQVAVVMRANNAGIDQSGLQGILTPENTGHGFSFRSGNGAAF